MGGETEGCNGVRQSGRKNEEGKREREPVGYIILVSVWLELVDEETKFRKFM